MLFHEPVFLYAFLPVTLAAFLLAQRHLRGHASNWILLSASLLFYGWWDPRLLPLPCFPLLQTTNLEAASPGRTDQAATRFWDSG